MACNFTKKETMAQVLSCEFCETSKITFFSYNTSGGCFCKLKWSKINFYLKQSRG